MLGFWELHEEVRELREQMNELRERIEEDQASKTNNNDRVR